MSKKYEFEFLGTKEMFIDMLNQFPNNDGKFYYFDDFIVKLVGDEISFGIERCGHSGGNWFIPTITEHDDRIKFCGKIQYIESEGEQSAFLRAIGKVAEILLFILLLPVYLVFSIYALVEWCIRKLFNRPNQKKKTTKDKLFDLMENYLNCIRL